MGTVWTITSSLKPFLYNFSLHLQLHKIQMRQSSELRAVDIKPETARRFNFQQQGQSLGCQFVHDCVARKSSSLIFGTSSSTFVSSSVATSTGSQGNAGTLSTSTRTDSSSNTFDSPSYSTDFIFLACNRRFASATNKESERTNCTDECCSASRVIIERGGVCSGCKWGVLNDFGEI